MSQIPKTIAYSPLTQLATTLLEEGTSAEVTNIAACPELAAGEEARVVFCADERFSTEDPTEFESCRVTSKHAIENTVGIVRGTEGLQQEWPAGTFCRFLVTADGWNKLRQGHLDHIAEDETDDVHGYKTYIDERVDNIGAITVNDQLVREVV